MKTKILILITFAFWGLSNTYAQVGIGTENPKTTLKVKGDPASTTTADGMQVPALSLAELDGKIDAYGEGQDGAIVYIDDLSTTSSITETAGITVTGFYYYQSSSGTWEKVGSSAASTTTYSVGDYAHGGIVFALDETGQHGLVCAIEDQSSGIQWSPEVIYTKARGKGVYAGKSNTIIIISVITANYDPLWWDEDYAALVCADYDGGGLSDWYLLSKIELQLM